MSIVIFTVIAIICPFVYIVKCYDSIKYKTEMYGIVEVTETKNGWSARVPSYLDILSKKSEEIGYTCNPVVSMFLSNAGESKVDFIRRVHKTFSEEVEESTSNAICMKKLFG